MDIQGILILLSAVARDFVIFHTIKAIRLLFQYPKTLRWNTLFFSFFYVEVSRIVTYFRNSILATPSLSLINMTYPFKFRGLWCSHGCDKRIIGRYQNIIISLIIIWLPFESSSRQNLTPQLPHPLTSLHTVIALENTLRKSVPRKPENFCFKNIVFCNGQIEYRNNS